MQDLHTLVFSWRFARNLLNKTHILRQTEGLSEAQDVQSPDETSLKLALSDDAQTRLSRAALSVMWNGDDLIGSCTKLTDEERQWTLDGRPNWPLLAQVDEKDVTDAQELVEKIFNLVYSMIWTKISVICPSTHEIWFIGDRSEHLGGHPGPPECRDVRVYSEQGQIRIGRDRPYIQFEGKYDAMCSRN